MSPLQILNSHRALRIALLAICLGFLASFVWLERSVAANSPPQVRIEDADSTLAEIRDKQRVALLITRNSVVDASGSDEPIVAEALATGPREALRHRNPYRVITRKLNEYLRKYRSLRPVYEIGQADFLIYFRLVEYRRTMNGFYPYGELFVIVNQRPGETRPARIIWRTTKIKFAEDAVKDLLKELKQVRAER